MRHDRGADRRHWCDRQRRAPPGRSPRRRGSGGSRGHPQSGGRSHARWRAGHRFRLRGAAGERRRSSSIPVRSPRIWSGRSLAPESAGSITRLVALSAGNADDDVARQPSRFRGDRNKEVEQLAVDSGLAWVSLRPAVFASTSADMWSAQLRAGDVVSGPFADASFAPIVDSDIAAVAAHALLGGHLDGRRIPLTGPQAFTVAEQVAVIGDVLGPSAAVSGSRPRPGAEPPRRIRGGTGIRRCLHRPAGRRREPTGGRHRGRRSDLGPASHPVRPVGGCAP